MVATLLLAAAVWWGFSLVRISGARLSAEERIVVGPIVGLAAGFWLIYLMASVMGRLSPAVIVAAFVVFAGGGVLSWRRPSPKVGRPGVWFVALAATLGTVLVAMNLHGVMALHHDAYLAQEHVWADMPFHLSIVTSFGFRENYPPMYPTALGEPLGYPFLVNYISGVLLRTGLGLRGSVLVVNVAVQLLFFLAVAVVARRVTGSRRIAVLSAGLLFCLGNLGWLAIPQDVAQAGGVGEWLARLPWSYTGDALGEPGRERLGMGVYLGNPTFIFFMPRRAAAFGLAVGAVLLLLFDELRRRPRLGTAVLTGLLLGLLPRIHGHTLMAMVAFVGVWFVALPAFDGRRGRDAWLDTWRRAAGLWVVVGMVALALALPQLLEIRGQASGFFSWWFGWTGEPNEAAARIADAHGIERLWAAGVTLATVGWFWLVNAGFLLVLAVPAWLRADRRLRLWYAPFIVLWLFANLVRTQPWEWDNNNFFVYWQLGTAVLVSSFLVRWLDASDRGRRTSVLRPVAVVVLLVGLTLGGFLSFLFAAQQRHHLWTTEEAAFAHEVREAVPSDGVVLTSNGHTHPVIALSGRQAFMGFTGWILTHGLDWSLYEDRLAAMYQGDVELMADLGIRHVVVGPWEQAFAAERGFELAPAFADPTEFRVVERRAIDGRPWTLLERR